MTDTEIVAKIVAIITDADTQSDNDHIGSDEATARDLASFDAIVEVLAAERKIMATDTGSWN
jgi:hypothetical protein